MLEHNFSGNEEAFREAGVESSSDLRPFLEKPKQNHSLPSNGACGECAHVWNGCRLVQLMIRIPLCIQPR